MTKDPELRNDDWPASRLLRISEITADFRGARYLQALVLALARVLQVRFAMIAVRREGREHAQVLAIADGEDLSQPFRYLTRELPCHTVLGGEAVSVPCNIVELYPGANEIEAYVGQPLKGRDGAVIGLLAVEHTAPITSAAGMARVLRALAGRTAAEIEGEPDLLRA
ncbi:hypothetical protein GCM10025771_07840 [Niveibacterium umoris]|uniref:GAF domain-containing protein n=1 Tax=Niveibacterium umoris TaxID=1193620 RepID=A0A840BQC1_9RHOO|nr:GAF domain-containing protein [Niveibacterium umoris]MBB4013669.1 hypothetical protein [Niveibacterium umoris]